MPKLEATTEGELYMDVKCGTAVGKLFVNKVRNCSQGSNTFGKTVCILGCPSGSDEEAVWLSFTKFQEVGGRTNARNCKRSITHQGQTLYRYWDWLLSGGSSGSSDVSIVMGREFLGIISTLKKKFLFGTYLHPIMLILKRYEC